MCQCLWETKRPVSVFLILIYKTNNIKAIKANTKEYFNPQPINLSPLKLLIGSAVKSDITLVDHDRRVQTATYTTIMKYLDEYDLIQEQLTVHAE